MKIYNLNNISAEEKEKLLARPSSDQQPVLDVVRPVVEDIKKNGLKSALEYARRFDGFPDGGDLLVREEEFEDAAKKIDEKVKSAILKAAENIRTFHARQYPAGYETEVRAGVICSREYRAIEDVGLYIPGGSAVLPSTMLMLGIPAAIAGCSRVVVCSPAKNGSVNYPLLFAAKTAGVTEFYKIGGAQAVALMAYGSRALENFPAIKKVSKIFGPGNQYVTAAKMLVSTDISGCAIDMPAGPSELLVIAGANANPGFVAADLLSQAEHGADSQVVLVSDSSEMVAKVLAEVEEQIKLLPRKAIAEQALLNSYCLITASVKDAIEFSNVYAPEHLSLQVDEPGIYKQYITNAGSVFMGSYSPESAGDYASGTNHSLPTSGFARSFGGVSVESFMKSMTFQHLSREGLSEISETIKILAEVETLFAHKNAVSVRLEK
ncbi:MAG: histidinol dehydrogenase [Bacteroidota bacterium]